MTRADSAELTALAVRAKADSSLLDDLLRELGPYMTRVCRRFLPNELDAEEATQDALVAVASSLDRFDPDKSAVTTWAFTIASNKSRDTYRRLVRQSADVLPDELPEQRRTSVLAGNRIDLLSAADAIDDRYSQTVLLRDLAGLSYEELAVTLDVPIGTVRSRLSKGRELMAEQLRVGDS